MTSKLIWKIFSFHIGGFLVIEQMDTALKTAKKACM